MTRVLSKSGLTITSATSQIESITKDHQNDIIILNVGSVDVQNYNHVQLTDKYSQLVEKTKQVSPRSSIVITAVPRRLSPGSSEMNRTIDELNKSLRFMCEQDDTCWFLDCNPDILLKNYKYDGIHFSLQGTMYFANELSNFIKSNFQMDQFPVLI